MTNLLDLIGQATKLRHIAQTNGGEWAGPCPWCGGRDRFRVWPNADRPGYWCRQCDRRGDTISFLRERQGLSFADAANWAGRSLDRIGRPVRRLPVACRTIPDSPAPPGEVWQAAARELIEEAEATLWAPAGAKARAWLTGPERRLSEATIQAARLGYLSAGRREPGDRWGLDNPVWLPRSIVIPWERDGTIEAFKFRLAETRTGPKYTSLTGSRGVLYRVAPVRGRPIVVLTEGEFDCLLLGQVAGDVAGVATLGGASAVPTVGALAECLDTRAILVALDRDQAGQAGAAQLIRLKRFHLAPPPGTGDLTDADAAGFGLRAWLAEAIRTALEATA